MRASSLQLWRDRRGRLSGLRIAALCFLLLPVALAVTAAFSEVRFGARPLNDLIHRTGYWALVFLLVSLAITPLRRVGRYGTLVDVRRMIGVGAFCYAAVHIGLYVADQMFDLWKVGSEIVLRVYLTIGFIALVGLTALAVTSTDGMIKRLGGRRWQRLHQIVYVIALLALIHFFQQTKADVWWPTLVAGLFGWLMGYRVLVWSLKTRAEPTAWMLAGLSVAVGALTFVAESVGIGIAFKVSPLTVLETAFDYDLETWDVRPGWLVLAAGLCVALVDVVRSRWQRPKSRSGGRPSPATPPASQVEKSLDPVS